MKKYLVSILTLCILSGNLQVLALSVEESEHLRDMRVQPSDTANAPLW